MGGSDGGVEIEAETAAVNATEAASATEAESVTGNGAGTMKIEDGIGTEIATIIVIRTATTRC